MFPADAAVSAASPRENCPSLALAALIFAIKSAWAWEYALIVKSKVIELPDDASNRLPFVLAGEEDTEGDMEALELADGDDDTLELVEGEEEPL